MIVYFADRQMQVLGLASTNLPEGFVIIEDLKTEEVETGVATFSCRIGFNKENRMKLESMTDAGNYLLRSHDGENEFYTIIDTEIDTKNQTINIYAEDAGLDLLNEVAGEFEATESNTAEWYINKYIVDSGFEIGINEIPSTSKRKLKWEGEETVTARLASIATQFDGYEISYSFEIKGLTITNKYVNIHKERGKDVGITLRLNQDIDKIITTKSVANLATAFVCEGGVPDKAEEPITLSGYKYDDGDFFVDGDKLKSRKANEKWSRYVWNKEPNKLANGEGYIVRPYSYNTTDQKTLCSHAITELKKVCDMEVNYEIDIKKLPANVKIGDRINIVDDAGELYVSTRILMLETSVVDQKHDATLGEHLIKTSGISQKVMELAEQFAKTSVSAAKALSVANAANAVAEAAQTQAEAAVTEAENATAVADEAKTAAQNANTSANEANTKADAAQEAVAGVEATVSEMEQVVTEAEELAESAKSAADSANTLSEEAKSAASNAVTKANEANDLATDAKTLANSASSKADTASTTANEAKTQAQSASEIAAAAKTESEQAQKDVDEWAADLETYKKTVTENYAKKTDLTETSATLQAQITANANQLEITHSKVLTVDETANNAKELAEAAQSAADDAQATADQATADAEAAQSAADKAQAAADAAQTDADNAKAAADAAQGVADQANTDLATAKANLASVTSRVDATEQDIAEAQAAVTTAQQAADKANDDAAAAAKKAEDAQSTANTAVTNAANAKTAADNAASKATIAQAAADEAKGDAAAAQATANEAKTNAANAQATANTAVTNAATAQAKADQAALDAAAAQDAADDADAKAAQAQTDLNAAKQNLADTISRVDATEEDIAAAEKAVEDAQKAADDAQDAADAAQSTANTAKANAATAQTAANNAKTAADNAKKAADEAQAAADKAQADANALGVRVTTAETNITKNSEAIKLAATKTEVAETLGGYYTKEEANAAIEVSANSVKTMVSANYTTKGEFNNLEIGGRNLVPVSCIQENASFNAETTKEFYLRWAWATSFVNHANLIKILEPSTQYTIYFEVELSGRTTVPTLFSEDTGFILYSPTYGSSYRSFLIKFPSDAEIGTVIKKEVTFTTPDTWTDESILAYSRRWTTEGASPIGNDVFIVRNFKIEKGNKATDWTPAPEDYSTTAEMESKIEQTANSITSSVSSTYAKKTLPDTRNDNQTPEWYITNYPQQIITEFKLTSVIGLSGETYCALTTTVPWGNNSGGYPKQAAKVGTKEFWRYGTNGTTWSAWKDALGTAENAQSRVGTCESNITQLGNKITSNVTEIGALKTRASTLEQTAESISTRVTNVENMEIGGRNLLLNSAKPIFASSAAGITGSNSASDFCTIVASSGNSNWCSFYFTGYKYSVINSELSDGDTFTISFLMRSADSTTPPKIYIKSGLGYYAMSGSLSSEWSKVWYTGTWKTANGIEFHFGFSGCVGTYDIKNCKIEKGSKPTDWTPAPEEIETRVTTAESNISQNASSIAAHVTEISGLKSRTSSLEQTSNSITTKVSALENMEIGGRNLILNSDVEVNHTATTGSVALYSLATSLSDGETYTVSMCITPGATVLFYEMYTLAPGYKYCCGLTPTSTEKHIIKKTFTATGMAACTAVEITRYPADSAGTDTTTIHWIKLEKGDKSTDWTPAPEDVDEDISNVADTAGDAKSTADGLAAWQVNAQSEIQQLIDKIPMLVVGSDGATLWEQTAEGWSFNFADAKNAMDATTTNTNDVADLKNDLGAANGIITDLQNALAKNAEYITFGTTDDGKGGTEPCIELGVKDSIYKVLITNSRIIFKEGSKIPVYISEERLVSEKVEVTQELQQTNPQVTGRFVWQMRKNGNYGLSWKGE